jgi:hypothetical protein
MDEGTNWLIEIDRNGMVPSMDGLVPVRDYDPTGRRPEEVELMEKARAYKAQAVFFEAAHNDRPPLAQAFVYVSDGPADDPLFGELHRRLWSWGGVPLVYRRTRGLIQLFRCAHNPDFVSRTGETICKPFKTLNVAASIANDPWWDALRLRNGTLWDDPKVCKAMLSANKAAHKRLIQAVKELHAELNEERVLKERLRRKLLILSLLIAYLEERGVFPDDYFDQHLKGATRFFQVLANGKALVALLAHLEERFNGNVFVLSEADALSLKDTGQQLARFACLVAGKQEKNGQLTLWQLYSFRDLPVELISHIYQLFVTDTSTSVYTPPFMVRLMLDEALNADRLDRLHEQHEIIVDPSCGSGIFLVEAYKRLVLHWRSRNNWKRPGVGVLKDLLEKVHGIDLEPGAIELAAFSLCLALCDALEPETIRATIKLFPPLAKRTLHQSCFFEAKKKRLLRERIGIVIGNPPFSSSLSTPAAQESYDHYEATHGSLPDKQLAYLFLHEAMGMMAVGGVLAMLQQYNFLYNQQSLNFRGDFIQTWDVREILDFVSIRGLFQKGGADTKVIVIVAEANTPPPKNRRILHATFRRSGRVDAEQGFDIDYYDLHWMPRTLALANDRVWRANLFGGGRSLGLANRLKEFRTLEDYAVEQKWDFGEGFIQGRRGVALPSDHIVGQPLLEPAALTDHGIDESAITVAPRKAYERPRAKIRFTPPMLLIREHMDIPHALWTKHYLTYSKQIVGFLAPEHQAEKLRDMGRWLSKERKAIKAYLALTSPRLFTQKATALQADDIYMIPYPASHSLDLSINEQILVDDLVDYYRDLVRLGDNSEAMTQSAHPACAAFSKVFTAQINAVYREHPLRALKPQVLSGVICQAFVFGKSKTDWQNPAELQGKLNALLRDQQGATLRVTRIARIYDDNFIFLIKPDRLRYWLRSVALRDADETLSDLRSQGF